MNIETPFEIPLSISGSQKSITIAKRGGMNANKTSYFKINMVRN